uniref:Uncharacterized protein n=1 Tax=Phlegmariurus squarrosus TaxID=73615 RepID=H9M870_PHLSQ|nr:hypothetical protein HusqMp90 [Phlegmariurus squarrosus]AEV55777.1 hypothetical protein HusqMp90 [Phlegmariurus squarrosus]
MVYTITTEKIPQPTGCTGKTRRVHSSIFELNFTDNQNRCFRNINNVVSLSRNRVKNRGMFALSFLVDILTSNFSIYYNFQILFLNSSVYCLKKNLWCNDYL